MEKNPELSTFLHSVLAYKVRCLVHATNLKFIDCELGCLASLTSYLKPCFENACQTCSLQVSMLAAERQRSGAYIKCKL